MHFRNKKTPLKAAISAVLLCAVLLCGCKADEAAPSSEAESEETSAVESEETSTVAALKSGYGLYIDGHFVAACDGADDVLGSVDEFTKLLALSYGMSARDSFLDNDVRTLKNEYDEACFVDKEGLLSLLGCNAGGVSFNIVDCNGAKIDVTPVVIQNGVSMNEEPCEAELVVRETDLLGVGEKLTVTEAVDGVVCNTYSFTVENGVTVKNEVIDSVVTVAPVDGEEWVGSESGATLMSVNKKFMLPYDGRISSDYGWRTLWGEADFHNGLDFVALEGGCYGDPIYAVEDGVVSFSDRSGGYGRLVIISHSQSVDTLYAHCSQLLVEEGDTVKRGDVIALVGNSGKVTGAHLHFGVRVDGEDVDPTPYLDWSNFKG